MRDYARESLQIAKGRTRADLDTDRMLNLSLVRLLEILGEAANRVPAEEQVRYPQIPWLQLINLRNRLIHAYDKINFDILWQIINKDLPNLLASLEEIVPLEED